MVTVDYDFYKNQYHGVSLTEDDFERQIVFARYKVTSNTNRGIINVDDNSDPALVEAIRMCYCAVSDILKESEANDGKVISSRTAGKLSESYSVTSSSTQTYDGKIRTTVNLFLADFGLTCMWI